MPKYKGVGRIRFSVLDVVSAALKAADIEVKLTGLGFSTGASFEIEFVADNDAEAVVHADLFKTALQDRIDPMFVVEGIDVRDYYPPLRKDS